MHWKQDDAVEVFDKKQNVIIYFIVQTIRVNRVMLRKISKSKN